MGVWRRWAGVGCGALDRRQSTKFNGWLTSLQTGRLEAVYSSAGPGPRLKELVNFLWRMRRSPPFDLSRAGLRRLSVASRPFTSGFGA